jgi:hypothetical protein
MANSVSLVSVFLALIDEAYKLESKTAALDALTQAPSFLGANEVKVFKLSSVGLGTYSRVTGYPAGDITASWETMTLAAERGRAFTMDREDNEEMLGLALGNFVRMWMREHVAPEFDAYRFAKYAAAAIAASNYPTPATLSSSTVVAAIDVEVLAMNEDEVPEEGRKLYMSPTVKQYLEAAISRSLGNENTADKRLTQYLGMDVVSVPQGRFYTAITLNAGSSSSAGGYVKNVSTGKDINFMIVHPTAVVQPIKLNQVKYFSPEVNQLSDGHLWQYRAYHDAFVYDNHVNGIRVHHKA